MNHCNSPSETSSARGLKGIISTPERSGSSTTTVAKVCLGSKAHIDVGYAHVGQVPTANTRRPSASTSVSLAFPAARIAI
jgi:hypothetical protein